MLVPGGQFQNVMHQAAAAATGDGQSLTVAGASVGAYSTWAVQVWGTFAGTVTFEGTVDGSTWVPVEMTSVGDAATASTTATAAGVWRANVLGLSAVRARVSAYSSGAINVMGQVVVG